MSNGLFFTIHHLLLSIAIITSVKVCFIPESDTGTDDIAHLPVALS